jgi:hypothetical protein
MLVTRARFNAAVRTTPRLGDGEFGPETERLKSRFGAEFPDAAKRA